MPAETHRSEPRLVDLMHLGRPKAIGAWLLEEEGIVVDPGPASCLPVLLPILEASPPRTIALTHIHLDHAGATGTLAARFPQAEVWVHERGAPHMIDPARLLASAGRLYGEHMDTLWGEFLPVPADRIRVLSGGERIGSMLVAYTPGHASHHVAYLHEGSGYAFAGDVAGVRIDGGPTTAPTPPPDIDLRLWRESIGLLESWAPEALAITHFGVHRDVAGQLAQLRSYLQEAEELAATNDAEGFLQAVRARTAALAPAELASTYEQAMPSAQSYGGLRRYLEKSGRLAAS
jgi:glyoxylase-like metal-dependent hydrolase (beta-lactamase superfamily II)